MIRVAQHYGVDIVGGPVFPVFDNARPLAGKKRLLRAGALFHRTRADDLRRRQHADPAQRARTISRRAVLRTLLRSPAAATTNSSGAAASTAAALPGPTKPKCSKPRRRRAPPSVICCAASSATAPKRPASSASSWQRHRRLAALVHRPRPARCRHPVAAARGIWRPPRHDEQPDPGGARRRPHRRRIRSSLRAVSLTRRATLH